MITPFEPELVNPASYDIRLGDTILIESAESPDLVPYPLHRHSEAEPYWLVPGQFFLAESIPIWNLPHNISAQFVLKSSRAREGLQHLLAGYCDPGWSGSRLTMELKNIRQLHQIAIWPGMRVGQMVFTTMDAIPRRDYRITGRYNNDTSVQGSKGHV